MPDLGLLRRRARGALEAERADRALAHVGVQRDRLALAAYGERHRLPPLAAVPRPERGPPIRVGIDGDVADLEQNVPGHEPGLSRRASWRHRLHHHLAVWCGAGGD